MQNTVKTGTEKYIFGYIYSTRRAFNILSSSVPIVAGYELQQGMPWFHPHLSTVQRLLTTLGSGGRMWRERVENAEKTQRNVPLNQLGSSWRLFTVICKQHMGAAKLGLFLKTVLRTWSKADSEETNLEPIKKQILSCKLKWCCLVRAVKLAIWWNIFV